MAKEHRYTVRGIWPFPLDMLRHDRSRAATAEDQAKIDRYSGDHAPDRDVFEPVEINLVGPDKPASSRWDSFTWEVTTDAIWRWEKAGREQDRKRRGLRESGLAKLTDEERQALGFSDDKGSAQ